MATIGTTGTYTTIAAWEADAPATLTAIWLGECQNQEFTEAVTIAGSTSTSSFYKHLTTASGASFADNANKLTNALKFNTANGAAITVTAGYTDTITVSENYFRLSKLQVQRITGGGASKAYLDTGVIGTQVSQCIMESDRAASVARFEQDAIVSSCLFVGRNSAVGAIVTIGNVDGTLINCTMVVPSDFTASTDAIARSYASGWAVINCAMFGATNTESGTGSAPTFTTCRGNDASPPTGVTTTAYDTTTGSGFENTTDSTRDFRIKTGSALKDAGTTNSLGSPDAAGTARPSGSAYDIGAWEFAAAAAAGAATLTMAPMTPGGWSRR